MARHILEAFLNSVDFVTPLVIGTSIFLTSAWDSLKKKFKEATPAEHVKNYIKEYYHDFIGPEMVLVEERIENLLKDVEKWSSDVVHDINAAVGDALNTGQVPEQTDGQLGETRDIFTPDGDIPVDVGTMPGMGTEEAGIDRTSGDYSSGSSGGSGTTATNGPTTPATTPSTTTTAPTATDLGLDPNAGDYIEYQPSEGQVSITHADGTVETRPWPP